MSYKLQFNFLVDKDNKTLTVRKEFAADVLTVWDAFTKPEFLDLWLAPKPWKARTKSQEFKEGGKHLYAMVGPEGEEHWSIFKYFKIEKPEFYTGLDAFSDAQGNINNELPQMNWKVSFTDKGRTTMIETIINFVTVEQLEKIMEMGFKEGYSIALQGLEEVLPLIHSHSGK